MSEQILTDDEIGSCFRFSRFEMCRAINSAIIEKLPSLGYVKLGPGQVVAKYECNGTQYDQENCDDRCRLCDERLLVEVTPCA